MSEFTIKIYEDGLEARLSIVTNESSFPTEKDIYNELKSQNIIFGIDKGTISRIVSEKKGVDSVVIAAGDRGEGAKDAELLWYIDVQTKGMKNRETGKRVNFKDGKEHFLLTKGQELVSKLPPVKGKNGKNIFGETKNFFGKDIPMPQGKNTVLSKDGLTLLAENDGYATLIDGKVNIDNTYHVYGNVDFTTGNINYDGSVEIEGDVRSGFKVYANEDIIVHGNVDAAEIFTRNGNVTVDLGILGKGKAKVLAGGNVLCGFVQDSTIGAKGNIIISHYAFNSFLTSGKDIIVSENEGIFRGGSAIADNRIEVKTAGSSQNKLTQLRIAEDELSDSSRNQWEMKKTKEELESELLLAKKRADFLQLLAKRLNTLSPEKQKELNNILDSISSLEEKIKQIEAEGQSRDASANKNEAKEKYIVVKEKCHVGVDLYIGNSVYKVDNVLLGLKAVNKNGDLKIISAEEEI